ncbi:hypothetical protein KUA50_015840 (plasmid) [Segatella hominis]|uniref:hypothetical protein n=1 Tax=Segatella hominis TaxID=2518605 RepID=UPI001C45C4C1|nr:hypothetical protein [Segatella hominis]WOZ83160.1 hypothetical protein KUA50_015840 [Segatella hominis]
MAKEVSFTIKLDDRGTFKKVTMDAEQLGRAVRSVQDESEKAKRSVLTWAETSQAIDVLQSSIGELQGVVSDLTSAYQVQLVAETQIETIMRQRMAATDEQIQSIKNLCSAQQELGVIGDEVQLSGAQQMATFLQNKRSLDVLIPAMNNLVAQQNGLNATNQDAVSIGNMMGKAMQGQVEVLQRVGITFDESQKKVLQYGTESERAAMLAKVITQNVGNMNAELAKTDAGKQKQLENTLGDIKEQMGALVQGIAPYVTMASQITITITGVVKLTTSLYAAIKAFSTLTVVTEATSRAKVGMTAVVRVLTATMHGEAVGATTAAVATRALGVAVKSLLISTGVGIAIVALTEAINYLMNSSDDAVKSVDNLSEAEQRAKIAHQQTAQQMASVRSEMTQNIATLKNFKGSKEQEKAMVQQMNTKYGEAMGYYSTVSQWYQALTANSKAYCNQMISEITIRNLANRAADLQQQRYDYTHDKNGKVKKFDNRDKIGYVKGEGLQILPGTSQKAEADKVVTNLYRQEQNIKKRMEALVKQNQNISYKHTAGYSATPPSFNASTGSTGNAGGSGNTNTGNTPGVTEDKKALEGSIDWYEEKINEKQKELNATADKATARALNAEIEGLQRQLYMLKVDVGIEDVPKVDVKAFAINLKAQLDEEMETMRQRLSDKPLVINTEVEAKARDYDHISSLFNIDVSNFESVRTGLADINGISDSTAKGMAAAGASCEMFGSALQQLGGDSAAAKAGMVAAAIGQFVLSFAQAMSTCKTWIEWLAFGISGTAQLTSIISTISQFATGGIVGGNQTSGDKVLVRVNSGEMILNAAQQARLFAIANGAAVQGVSVNTAGLQGIGSGMSATLGISGRLRGRDIVMAVANETRNNRRRSNIKI